MKEDWLSKSSFVDITEDNAGKNSGKPLKTECYKRNQQLLRYKSRSASDIRRPDVGITTET